MISLDPVPLEPTRYCDSHQVYNIRGTPEDIKRFMGAVIKAYPNAAMDVVSEETPTNPKERSSPLPLLQITIPAGKP